MARRGVAVVRSMLTFTSGYGKTVYGGSVLRVRRVRRGTLRRGRWYRAREARRTVQGEWAGEMRYFSPRDKRIAGLERGWRLPSRS